jgi:hypothetical protein
MPPSGVFVQEIRSKWAVRDRGFEALDVGFQACAEGECRLHAGHRLLQMERSVICCREWTRGSHHGYPFWKREGWAMSDGQDLDRDQSQEAEEAPSTDIPQEQAVEQRPVPFLGDELAAALTAGGSIYITLPGMCRALALNTQAQLRRMLRTPTLARGLRMIPIDTRGGKQSINCLRVDKIALWLAGIEPTRVKPEYRAKIEAYQEELAPIAMQVFMRVAGITTSQLVPAVADPQVAVLADQIDTLTDVVTFLREHMEALLASSGQVSLRLDQAISLLEALAERQDTAETQIARIDERTQRLTPAHARAVQDLVDRIVHETAHERTPLLHYMIYGRLKRRFRASTYKEIADDRYNDVMTFLQELLSQATGGAAPEQGSLF